MSADALVSSPLIRSDPLKVNGKLLASEAQKQLPKGASSEVKGWRNLAANLAQRRFDMFLGN
jgi:hypothetical protein